MVLKLNISWPLRNVGELTVLNHCEALFQERPIPALELDCSEVPYPSVRFLTLLMDIASMAPVEPVACSLLNAQASIVEALWLTGLDRWFSAEKSVEEWQ
ncbi:MAG: hypothetical protein P8X89_12585 [Reinekea sp.]|jgi:anti-anti-sigma regulatory factor